MIPHPAVVTLLAEHGNTADGRAKARANLRRAMATYFEYEVARAGRSFRCQNGDHRVKVGPAWDGCANDGSTCICECHDPGGTP